MTEPRPPGSDVSVPGGAGYDRGTVLKALDDAGIADDTFVVDSTDNGP